MGWEFKQGGKYDLALYDSWRIYVDEEMDWMEKVRVIIVADCGCANNSFSRGAFVALALSSLVLIILQSKLFKVMQREFVIVIAMLLASVAVSFHTQKYVDYWADHNTVATRVYLLLDTADGSTVDSDGLSYLLVYGIGGYGIRKFGSSDASTHNLF